MLQLRRILLPAIFSLLVPALGLGQQKSKVELEPDQTIFTTLAAMNQCGYDDDLADSDPIRSDVRAEISRAVNRSEAAAVAKQEMCTFYKDHQQSDPSRELSQYISLALNLGPAPDFKPKGKEADLPPDAAYVLGFVPLLAKFSATSDVPKIWNTMQPRYEAMIEKVHEPLANMILSTDVYLKMPISGYVGRQFVIYIEPLAAPGQINARNYGDDYFLVAAPQNGKLSMEQLQHTYLHFVLDPLMMKRPTAMKRLEPLLRDIQTAPLDDSYKADVTLLATESLIRSILDRNMPGGKNADAKREGEVAKDMAEGFILTKYFYDQLVTFEKDPTGLKDALPDWLYYMDVGRLHKTAQEIQFAAHARGEIVKSASAAKPLAPLEVAQQKLSEHDYPAAEKLAHDVADGNGPEAPRAYLILGQIATLSRDKDNAIKYFEEALRTAKDPRVIAWSHIYLGRIYDVDQERDMAVKHYQAALSSGDESSQIKEAAERGLKSAYERQAPSDQDKK